MLREGGTEAATTSRLSLEEKAALTGGADTWHTVAVPRLQVPALRLTDGPSGARGVRHSGVVSMSLLCGTALAATWNRDLVRKVGNLLGDEVRRKDAHVLLAPTVNVHRHPLAGRNFECFSEDPYLSAEMADAYIDGVQARGVGCAIKHLVGNDQERDRTEISVDVDERTLREVYLPAFETAVRSTGVWAVMTAYNRLHGIHCSEHAGLLQELLRGEWGFDGLVMSDWFGTHSTLAVSAGLDLEMPGQPRYLGMQLVAAVHQHDVDEWVLDRAAGRVLGLVERVMAGPRTDDVPAAVVSSGALLPQDGEPLDQATPDRADGTDEAVRVARDAAAEAIVLLSNHDLLPLDTSEHQTIAVVGPKADRPDIQGGGSAHVDPPYAVTPLEGIISRAGLDATILHEVGTTSRAASALTGERDLSVPETGERGLLVEYFAGGSPHASTGDPGDAVHREVIPRTRLYWIGEPAPGLDPTAGCTVRATADFVPERAGPWRFSLASIGASRLLIDGEVVVDNLDPEPGTTFYGGGSTFVDGQVELKPDRRYRMALELFVLGESADAPSGIVLRAQAPELPYALERAVTAATEADVAVVVVGEDKANAEGEDRESIDLPDDQVKLLRAVAAVNPATVVVVNTAAPVAMDWADEVSAVVQLWYLGQETGAALAGVLFGDMDASGRLPTTFPHRLEDTPASRFFPGRNGRVRYGEGVLVGYRHYDTLGVEPLFCFGHGLSYTEFVYQDLQLTLQDDEGDSKSAIVEVEVTNVGARRGREVVQVYVHDEEASLVRPEQELKQFCKLDLAAGESQRVRMELPWRAFAFWDPSAHGWKVESGRFEIRVGSSSRAIHRIAHLDL